ncbi:hypothetical protein HPG69_001560 [Diceros bicornis minor]|uniref:Uncharacterized protein n=1 Tax=Diceros bicornis minor TaxID=77932 RepID=A0A7J7FG88_DICBM|nr:hypothetical protein HPG69_001560 [Diceros bicornis minor]
MDRDERRVTHSFDMKLTFHAYGDKFETQTGQSEEEERHDGKDSASLFMVAGILVDLNQGGPASAQAQRRGAPRPGGEDPSPPRIPKPASRGNEGAEAAALSPRAERGSDQPSPGWSPTWSRASGKDAGVAKVAPTLSFRIESTSATRRPARKLTGNLRTSRRTRELTHLTNSLRAAAATVTSSSRAQTTRHRPTARACARSSGAPSGRLPARRPPGEARALPRAWPLCMLQRCSPASRRRQQPRRQPAPLAQDRHPSRPPDHWSWYREPPPSSPKPPSANCTIDISTKVGFSGVEPPLSQAWTCSRGQRGHPLPAALLCTLVCTLEFSVRFGNTPGTKQEKYRRRSSASSLQVIDSERTWSLTFVPPEQFPKRRALRLPLPAPPVQPPASAPRRRQAQNAEDSEGQAASEECRPAKGALHPGRPQRLPLSAAPCLSPSPASRSLSLGPFGLLEAKMRALVGSSLHHPPSDVTSPGHTRPTLGPLEKFSYHQR